MADYYYVKNSIGARTTGGGTTKQSGDFATLGAAAVYATVALAVADGASSGDIICVSDASGQTEASADIYLAGPTTGAFLSIICVEDLACQTDSIAAAAQFDTTLSGGGNDIYITGYVYLYGLWLKSQDNITMGQSGIYIEEECTREVAGAGDIICNASSPGISATFIEPRWIGVAGANPINIGTGTIVELFGGSFSGLTDYITSGEFYRGASLRITGTDLSSITGGSSYLFKDMGEGDSDGGATITLDGCKLSAALGGFLNENLKGYHQSLVVTHSAATSAAAKHQFHIVGKGGYIDDQDDFGIHRDESTAFPSGTKVSAHCVTNSGASVASPFWFNLPAQPIDLSSASTDTIRIYLASTTALDDLDVWAEVLYSDGTNQHEYNFLSSRNADRLATSGTALATDSGSTWKNGVSDLAGYNEYYIDLDTSGNAGAECVPIIRIYASIASTVIYFDTSIEAVA